MVSEYFYNNFHVCTSSIQTCGTQGDDGFVIVADDELINDMLMRRLLSFENTVNKSIKVEINQNQFDALVSFIFNVGITAFKRSTLLKMINRNAEWKQ